MVKISKTRKNRILPPISPHNLKTARLEYNLLYFATDFPAQPKNRKNDEKSEKNVKICTPPEGQKFSFCTSQKKLKKLRF